MPEGPETHRIADRLRDAIAGEVLTRVRFIDPALKRFEAKLRRREVLAVQARGKALLTTVDGGWTLYTHSQLFGFWRIDGGDAGDDGPTAPRLQLETARCRARLFAAPSIQVIATDAVDAHPFLRKLGPDVIPRTTTVRHIKRQLADARFARKPLADLLLDQSFAAGMGNYLRSEVLHAARIAPKRTPASLAPEESASLARALLSVPRASYRAQTRIGSRHATEGFRFKVFERDGEPCPRDGHPIEQVRLGGRRLYWCPACQH